MDRYEEYKDSGVDWIGEIPAGWEVDKVKRFCSVIPGATPSSKIADYWNGDVPWITPADYSTEQHYVFGGSRFITEKGLNSCGASLVPRGSVIVSNRAPIGQVAVAAEELCTNQGCKSLVPLSEKGNSEYLYWYLSVQSETLNSYGKGTTFLELSSNALADFPVPSLAPSEQECIVGFLKRKTAEIDSLVEDCEREVELLQEYRKAVISGAVTKGLDPNAPMKDSGIDWIGEIPEKWSVPKLSQLAIKIGSGKTPHGGAEIYSTEGTLFLRSQNIYNEGLKLEDVVYISDSIDEQMAGTRVYEGDVLLNITGGSIGRSALYVLKEHANVNQHVCIIRLKNNIVPGFIHYYWISELGSCVIDLHQTGANREGLNFSQIGNARIPLPLFHEQLAIVAYLDAKTAEIDSLIADYQAMADKLREYRKSLISEAVTGKFKVPGVA